MAVTPPFGPGCPGAAGGHGKLPQEPLPGYPGGYEPENGPLGGGGSGFPDRAEGTGEERDPAGGTPAGWNRLRKDRKAQPDDFRHRKEQQRKKKGAKKEIQCFVHCLFLSYRGSGCQLPLSITPGMEGALSYVNFCLRRTPFIAGGLWMRGIHEPTHLFLFNLRRRRE